MKPVHLYGDQIHNTPHTYIRRALVLKVRIEENLLFADIQDNFLGNIYTDVQVANYYSTDGSISNFPLSEDQEVLYIYSTDGRKPIIIGSLPHAKYNGYVNELTIDQNTDYPTDQIAISDHHTQNKNNFMNISKDSGITVDADTIRLQIDKVLRISSNGVIDSPLNGQNFIDIIFPYLQGIETKLLAMQALSVANTAACTAAAATAALIAANTSTLITPIQAQGQTTAATASTTAAAAAAGLQGAATAGLPSTAAVSKTGAIAQINQKVKLPL